MVVGGGLGGQGIGNGEKFKVDVPKGAIGINGINGLLIDGSLEGNDCYDNEMMEVSREDNEYKQS